MPTTAHVPARHGFPLLLAALAAAFACGGGDGPLPRAVSLEIVTGTNGQSAPAGARLPSALAVLARDESGGLVPRAAVRWAVASGAGAELSDTLTVTDGNGRAEVALTLGPAAGTFTVAATLADAADAGVTFTATATAPPQLTAVNPSTFSAGDTLAVTGSALAASAEVFVAGAPALVLSGSATTLMVVAPVCLPPGSVAIRAIVSGAPSNTIQGTYTASGAPLALAVGEYASIDPAQLGGCATFPAAGPAGAEYLLTPQSVSGLEGVSAAYRLAGDAVVATLAPPAATPTPLPFAERFHDALRRQEEEAARIPRPPFETSLRAAAADATVKVGNRRSFKVCSSTTCTNTVTVTAEAEYVGEHSALFVDTAAPAGGFTTADLQSLGGMFDTDLHGVDTEAFGSESDVDANGVVIILFTPAVNRLTSESQCGTSIITGYFFGIDIDPAFTSDSRSNRGEVFYALAPDPSGEVTCSLSTELVRRLVPVTFVHEFQHMISYYQHVLLRDGDSEVLWLNEGLSHLAEELAGLHFEAQGNDTLFSRFAIGNLYNANLYLLNPGAVFTFPALGTGSLEERGAGWLFVRWVMDQYGSGTSRLMVETSLTGADNVAAAARASIGQLLAQWFLANWVSDLPGFSAPDRLTYTTWQFRNTYQSLHDQLPSRFPKPYPLEPMLASAGTFQLDGTLRAGSGDYLRVVQGAMDQGFTVLLTNPSGGVLPANVAARLNVIRIQ